MTGNGKIIIPPKRELAVTKSYQIGDLKIETNGSAAQILAQSGNQWTGCSLALFVGVAVELDRRDQEIAALRSRLDALEKSAGVPQPVRNGPTERLDPPRIEIDAEEAERDYNERVRRVVRFFAVDPAAEAQCRSSARIRSQVNLTSMDGEAPNMPELVRIEQWLDRNGGAGWGG